MSLNQFETITSNANMIELMDLEHILEQTETSLYTFTNSDNIEISKIAKILFSNLRKIHSDLTSRIVETVTGNDENLSPQYKTVQSYDEKQFFSQSYNIPEKKTIEKKQLYKYTTLKEISIQNYTQMLHEMAELEEIYSKNPDENLHNQIKILQKKITRQKKRIITVSNKKTLFFSNN
jgi:hypothetical protein